MRIYLLLLAFSMTIVFSDRVAAQTVKVQDNKLVLSHSVTFKEGSSTLTDEAKLALTEVKAYLDEKSYISLLRIEGHVADEPKEQQLSEGRAMAVAKWLIDAGIDCKRLIVVGFGNTKPIVERGSENTRIVFANAALRGHAIGGMPVDGGGMVAIEACKQ